MTGPIDRMTVSDIAKLAGVKAATVSNWRRRYEDFPKPLPGLPGRPQFDGIAVREWLSARPPKRGRHDDAGSRYNIEEISSRERADDLVRTWGYASLQCERGTPLAVLIAAIGDDDITFSPAADKSDSIRITVDSLDTTVIAAQPVADAIREFLRTALDGIDRSDLIEAVADELDDLDRWRRTPDAVAAEQNLHNLIAELVPSDAQRVLDFACRTGGLLAATSRKHPKATVIGMESDRVKAYLARRRLSDGRHPTAVDHLDILAVDLPVGRTSDAVVSIPPFGRKLDRANDQRMGSLPYGAVRGVAAAAWPQLAAQALTPEGRAFLVLPHSLGVDDRVDHIRRALIRDGLLSAVVTLPQNAHPRSKGLLDLWVLDRRHERTANVLMVDYSYVDPSKEDAYAILVSELRHWLDGDFPIMAEQGELHFYAHEEVFWEEVDPIDLLGQTVILDPQYWCVRKSTPTAPTALIDAVDQATTNLADAQAEIFSAQVPDCQARPDLLTMVTIRDARDEGLLHVVRRTSASTESPTLTLAHAEAMRHGRQPTAKVGEPGISDQSPEDAVRQGDVLVWATTDRRVRTAISSATGLVPESAISILRCGPELDPGYVALAVAARRNAVHTTGSNVPKLRILELSLPRIPMERQRQIAKYMRTMRELADAARHVVHAADELEQALSDAVGSGKVAFAVEDNDQ